MTVAIKSLADGQLAATKGTIYTTPTSKQTVINRVRLVNTNSTTESVNLYLKTSGGSSRNLIPVDTQLKAGYLLVMDDVVTMEAADVIEGDTTTADKVNYIVSGAENS